LIGFDLRSSAGGESDPSNFCIYAGSESILKGFLNSAVFTGMEREEGDPGTGVHATWKK
jgi:hypothetical protein